MKLVFISDTHCRHTNLVVPDGDVLIHAGDFTLSGRINEIKFFNDWLETLPHPHKIICAGNHDMLFQSNPAFAKSLITNATYLQDEKIEINGISFYGSPWTPQFGNWAFMLPRNSEETKHIWSLVPQVDVLITHGPPYGILDKVEDMDNPSKMVSVGCNILRKELERIKPRVHVFGHIHAGYGIVQNGQTKFVNASVCDESYHPVNPVQTLIIEATKEIQQ